MQTAQKAAELSTESDGIQTAPNFLPTKTFHLFSLLGRSPFPGLSPAVSSLLIELTQLL